MSWTDSVRDLGKQGLSHLQDVDLRDRRVQLAIAAGGLTAVYIIRQLTKKRYKMPPGPRPWPIVGNILSLRGGTKEMYEVFTDLVERYGEVFTFHLGPATTIVLNGTDVVREALLEKGMDFSGRPQSYSTNLFMDYAEFISLGQLSPVWKVQRKIAHQALRKFATGVQLENQLYKRAEDLTGLMLKEDGKPFDPMRHISSVIYSSICSMIFGKIFEHDDPWLLDVIKGIDAINEAAGSGLLADIFPIFGYLPNPTVRKLKATMKEVISFIMTSLEEHRASFDPNDISDFVYLIVEAEKQAREDPSEDKNVLRLLEDKHFCGILFDMFSAGTDTTRMTLQWIIAMCIQNPEVQDKIQKEIDEVIGMDGVITLADRRKLPYTEAVVFETLRMFPVAPLGVPHVTDNDTTLRGYTIPKGTMVMMNIWNLHRSTEFWDDPEAFKPERWLDENGKHISHPFQFLAFSCGRRVCVGETLAKAQLHLLTAMLFQKLKIRAAPKDGEKFKAELAPGAFFCMAKSFNVIAERR